MRARIEHRLKKLPPILDMDEDGLPVAEMDLYEGRAWSSDECDPACRWPTSPPNSTTEARHGIRSPRLHRLHHDARAPASPSRETPRIPDLHASPTPNAPTPKPSASRKPPCPESRAWPSPRPSPPDPSTTHRRLRPSPRARAALRSCARRCCSTVPGSPPARSTAASATTCAGLSPPSRKRAASRPRAASTPPPGKRCAAPTTTCTTSYTITEQDAAGPFVSIAGRHDGPGRAAAAGLRIARGGARGEVPREPEAAARPEPRQGSSPPARRSSFPTCRPRRRPPRRAR